MLDDIPQIDEIDMVLDDLTSPTSLEVFEALLPYEDEMSTAAIGALALTNGGGGGPPTGAAGGVLGGTYPNPSFASDMATQAELDAHVNDAAAAHAATAVAFTPAGTIAAATVQAAIEEVASEAGGGVAATLFDANTILKADSDNTPAALTMGASTVLARLAAGSIVAATPSELRTLLDVPTNAEAVLDTLVDAKGDMILGSAADTVAKLTAGANGTVPTYQSGQTTGILPQFPPGYEFSYNAITSDATTTQTVQASATTIITATSVTYDGATEIWIEFGAIVGNSTAQSTLLQIWEDSTDIDRLAMTPSTGGALSVVGRIKRTPTAGAKVYTIRAWVGGGSTGTIYGATGSPAYLLVTKS